MTNFATTKLSSKGKVVIPKKIRKKLRLKEGDQFVVIGQEDAVILKLITPPSIDEFQGLLKEAKSAARMSKLKQSEVKTAIKKSRRP